MRADGLPPIDHLFSTIDEKKSAEWLGYCRFFSDQINLLLGEEIIPVSKWTKECGYYSNGCRAIPLSSNPDTFRSLQGDVTLDEFDFHEQQKESYKAAQPCLLWFPDEATIDLISTISKVPGTLFKSMVRNAESGKPPVEDPNDPFAGLAQSIYAVTLDDAVEEGFALKVWKRRIPYYSEPAHLNKAFVASLRAECASEADFRQEYYCEAPNSSALITEREYDDLLIVDSHDLPISIPDSLSPDVTYNDLYVGVDCGRVHDLTVVWVLEHCYDSNPKTPTYLRDVFRPVCVKSLRAMPFPAQEEAVRAIVSHPNVCKGLIDQGSVGRALADAVADEMGTLVEPYSMAPTRMAVMAERLRSFVQQKRIAQHPDPFVRKDVLCVHRDCVQNAGGSPRLVYQGHTETTHGDFFWAQALALQAACEATGIGIVTAAQIESEQQPQLASA